MFYFSTGKMLLHYVCNYVVSDLLKPERNAVLRHKVKCQRTRAKIKSLRKDSRFHSVSAMQRSKWDTFDHEVLVPGRVDHSRQDEPVV